MSLKSDPSRTLLIRKKAEAVIKRALSRVRLWLMTDRWIGTQMHMIPAGVEGYRKDLQGKVDQELLTGWWVPLIERAYLRGVYRSYADSRKASGERFEGGREELLRQLLTGQATTVTNAVIRRHDLRGVGGRFISPRTHTLALRLENELKGVTAATTQAMARELLNGLDRGHKVSTIARAMVKVVDGLTRNRATQIARSEIVRAHAEGQLDALEKLGHKVRLKAEWDTANDDRVCPQCADLASTEYTIEEARGLIPAHIGCRCSWQVSEEISPREVPTAKRLRRKL